MFSYIISNLIEITISYWRLLLGVFIAQGICGVILFEWAWKKTERVRLGEKAMFDEFPSFKRLDLHLWCRSKFYPGCVILLIPRTCWIFAWLFSIGIWQYLLQAGQEDVGNFPLAGWRREI